MARTQAELVAFVLGQLGAIQAGEAPSAEDTALVTTVLQGKIDELALRGTIYIPDTTDIPDAHFYWLSMALANEPVLADHFARPVDGTKVAMAEKRLRQLAPAPDDFGILKAVYF